MKRIFAVAILVLSFASLAFGEGPGMPPTPPGTPSTPPVGMIGA
jgi:hypothetical protein